MFNFNIASGGVDMKTFQSRVWICAFMTVVPAVVSAGQQTCANFVNGGFETGNFEGWTATAGASVIGVYEDRNYLPSSFPVSPFASFQTKLTAGPEIAANV